MSFNTIFQVFWLLNIYILKCFQISVVFMRVVETNTKTVTCHCCAGCCSFSSGKQAEQWETFAFGSYEDSFGLASYSSVLQHSCFFYGVFLAEMLHNLNINNDSRLEVNNNYSSTANYLLYTAKTVCCMWYYRPSDCKLQIFRTEHAL